MKELRTFRLEDAYTASGILVWFELRHSSSKSLYILSTNLGPCRSRGHEGGKHAADLHGGQRICKKTAIRTVGHGTRSDIRRSETRDRSVVGCPVDEAEGLLGTIWINQRNKIS